MSSILTSNINKHPSPHLSVLISIGASHTICGFAGEAEPRWSVATDYYLPGVHQKNYSHLEILELLTQDGNSLLAERLISFFIEYLLIKLLLVNPNQCKIFILENSFSCLHYKRILAKLLFLRFNSAAVGFIPLQPYALVALEKKTGLIVDVGFSETNLIPIVSGFCLHHILKTLSLGSHFIQKRIEQDLHIIDKITQKNANDRENIANEKFTSKLDPKLSKKLSDYIFRNMVELERLNKINNSKCINNTNGDIGDDKNNNNNDQMLNNKINGDLKNDSSYNSSNNSEFLYFNIPPGNVLRIRKKTLTESPCIMFDNSDDLPTLSSSILDILLECNVDIRVKLAHKIVPIGGASLMKGFSCRLINELNSLVLEDPKYISIKSLSGHFEVLPLNGFNPRYLAWIGASIYISINRCSSYIIERQEFLENKPIPDWMSIIT